MDKDVIQELIQSNKALIESLVKLTCALEKEYENILYEIKNIKDSIYLQEKFHRGH